MTGLAGTAPDESARGSRARAGDAVRATEVDLRLFGMVLALVVIWVGLGLANSVILQPVNFLTFSVQAASTAVLATGMVLVIVSRNIDLSVGSVVGLIGMGYAVFMADIVPTTIGLSNPVGWIIALALGILLRCPDRRVPGLPDRLRRNPVVRRDARRAARLPRPHLAVQWRHDGRPEPADVQPPRRRAGRLARWRLGLGSSARSSASPPSCSCSTPAAPGASTASRSGLCGPRQ